MSFKVGSDGQRNPSDIAKFRMADNLAHGGMFAVTVAQNWVEPKFGKSVKSCSPRRILVPTVANSLSHVDAVAPSTICASAGGAHGTLMTNPANSVLSPVPISLRAALMCTKDLTNWPAH